MLHDLRQRRATQLDLIVTDGHEELLAAIAAPFPATPRQRCVVHKQRNVMNAIPKRERGPIAVELTGIWKDVSHARRHWFTWRRFKANTRNAILKRYEA
ncbi:hypothetical protein KSF_000870 [Reticulibacter mediterranei]|uniref:Mutator family transposase n=1 Tax=Reticulibacter mediterranei TaxID=2778369 RepID=A0A8J3MWN7_9CHLR|nr:hypothetical protein KSF_000870 [Reticulibacter mediterranei]